MQKISILILIFTSLTAACYAKSKITKAKIELKTSSSPQKQGWKKVGDQSFMKGKRSWIFIDESTSDNIAYKYTISDEIAKLSKKGFELSVTVKISPENAANSLDLSIGGRRVFFNMSCDGKSQNVGLWDYFKQKTVNAKSKDIKKFHTYTLKYLPKSGAKLSLDGKVIEDNIELGHSELNYISIGGTHVLAKERTGKIEVKKLVFKTVKK